MIQVFKMLNGYYDEDVIPKFVMRNDIVGERQRNRGHSKQIFVQRSEKEIRANSFTRRVAPVWNSLSEKIVSAKSIDAFKEGLDKLWVNHPMKFDYTEPVVRVGSKE